MKGRSLIFFLLLIFLLGVPLAKGEERVTKEAAPPANIPILLYHRFGPVVADSMTVTSTVFESHLNYIKNNGYSVVPLRQLVDYYLRKGPPLPSHSLVITIDDGHKSVYTEMLPLLKKYRFPVTLFIYPSAISNASYALTWEQLKELKKTGLIEIQSHTYWHPNFKKDKQRLKTEEYAKLVEMQLTKSKEKIQKELTVAVDLLAWPFGIYDDELIKKAQEAGYVAAFSIERRQASQSDNIMKLPRFLLSNTDQGKAFEKILTGGSVFHE